MFHPTPPPNLKSSIFAARFYEKLEDEFCRRVKLERDDT
jgi:hypothetical protein